MDSKQITEPQFWKIVGQWPKEKQDQVDAAVDALKPNCWLRMCKLSQKGDDLTIFYQESEFFISLTLSPK
jgi:hypothetical protein